DELKSALWEERRTVYHGAMEIYKRLFIDHQAAELERDRLYYLDKMANAINDQDRERYLTALASRIKFSGDLGLLHKEDADRAIENIPSDYDTVMFNREYAADPGRAQRLLLYGAYPNMKPELRDELVKEAEEAVANLQPMQGREAAQ